MVRERLARIASPRSSSAHLPRTHARTQTPAGVFALRFICALLYGYNFPPYMQNAMPYYRLRLALDLASTVPGGGVEEEGGGGGGGGAQ